MIAETLRVAARPIATILISITICILAIAATIGYSVPEWFLGLGGTIILSEFGLRTYEKAKNVVKN